MSVDPQAFLTGQPDVVASFRSGVIELLDGAPVLDAVLAQLDAVTFTGDTVTYIAAAEAAVSAAYTKAVQALGDRLVN